ncbi:TetR family transcriptional regulator [Parafrankia irregularis]|uniref:TetR family transcriptional regulator n=1 Tax=Parafrankia irregularis TaxID=795642 RepID=UPI001F6130F1|nr:TetR family transcriptional regulator [Parafrankia irregularis]
MVETPVRETPAVATAAIKTTPASVVDAGSGAGTGTAGVGTPGVAATGIGTTGIGTPGIGTAVNTLRASDGRVPGRRGMATRQRLLDQTYELLRTTPYRELTVADIGRAAGTSAATFYQYFVDIEAAMLTLADQVAAEGAKLSELVDQRPWRGAAGWQNASTLVDGILTFWAHHQPVLRVVDLLTEEGDQRFRRVRVAMLNEITRALAAVIAEAQTRAGRVAEVAPMAMAGALVSMLAHVASHRAGFEAWEIPIDEMREAMTRLVFWGVVGPRVPKHL